MKAYALTHMGNVRTTNEDAYYLPQANERFAAVADGMGGHLAGEVASAMAIHVLAENLREHGEPNEEILQRAVSQANHAIYTSAQADVRKHGMGTTLTVLWFGQNNVYLSHVGDSRAYLYRNRALMQLSNDHSLVNEMIERGEITPREALTHPQRNFITRALGTNRHVLADILHLDYLPGDVWLLCSDGLTNYVRAPEIAEVFAMDIDWETRLQTLIDRALSRGGGDNITAVIVAHEEAEV